MYQVPANLAEEKDEKGERKGADSVPGDRRGQEARHDRRHIARVCGSREAQENRAGHGAGDSQDHRRAQSADFPLIGHRAD